ncbi:MAG: ParB/RepB/Spo0J family partition protein [Candidatus Thermoplasmatota archaeon]
MKIKLDKIVMDRFKLRGEIDKEHLDALTESFKEDGQWDPIIVRPTKDGKYELVSGLYRCLAARHLQWKEIEANVKDLPDDEADFLSLKTNLMRKDLDEIEEGKAIKKFMEKYGLSQREIADKLGKSKDWVGRRLSLVLKIINEAQDALAKGLISADHASLIAQISEDKYEDWEDKQKQFLDLIIENKWSRDETRKQLKMFLNDTIYTIGYAGRDLNKFIQTLEENKIELLVDIRESGVSRYKPEFAEDILRREFGRSKIRYERRPELGVHYEVRQPYLQEYLSKECLEKWYEWSVRARPSQGKLQDLLPDLVRHLKENGPACLMCEEEYSKPKGKQKHYCHRDILTDMLLGYEDKESPLMKFQKRIDL